MGALDGARHDRGRGELVILPVPGNVLLGQQFYQHLERFAEAEKCFRNAIEIVGEIGIDTRDEAWHMLGVSLLAQERLDEAAEAFQRALEVNPESGISRKQLEGLKQVEVARKMIADKLIPKVDRVV